MDSSNAEKAWDTVAQTREFMGCALGGQAHRAFMAGRASRDAEVAELTRLLAESRARFGDSEARRAELEALIEQLRDEANAIIDTTRENGTDFERGQENISERVFDVLAVHPSVVLEDRDREVAARTIDEFADLQERTTKLHAYAMDEDDWDEHKRLVTCLRNYSALIRKGERP